MCLLGVGFMSGRWGGWFAKQWLAEAGQVVVVSVVIGMGSLDWPGGDGRKGERAISFDWRWLLREFVIDSGPGREWRDDGLCEAIDTGGGLVFAVWRILDA
jgi:hypothetical protein